MEAHPKLRPVGVGVSWEKVDFFDDGLDQRQLSISHRLKDRNQNATGSSVRKGNISGRKPGASSEEKDCQTGLCTGRSIGVDWVDPQNRTMES
ncbi:MAG: hypothetical protein ACJZ17_04130 [Acidimicrobiales bacterium]